MGQSKKSRYFARIRRWCLQQEDVVEEFPWGITVFKVNGKVFAMCDPEPPLTISLKPRKENLDAYLYLPDVAVAAYVGRYGWITVTASDKQSADLAFSLVKESYGVKSAGKKK